MKKLENLKINSILTDTMPPSEENTEYRHRLNRTWLQALYMYHKKVAKDVAYTRCKNFEEWHSY